jgi:hypothetical protein
MGGAGGGSRGGRGAGLGTSTGGASAAGSLATGAGEDTVAGAARDFDTGNTPLHTWQRARTPPAGILAGSTRYTVSQDGQVTFMRSP